MNQIYFGDNLKILKGMPSESVDLIYIDPPFNTKKTQKRTTIKTVKDENGDRKGFKGDTYRTVELGTKSYQDTFDSYDFYINEFIKPRLHEAYRVLKANGSLYFHIDYREVHYCKVLLDQIFGRECFLNEIIWAYDYGGRARSKWPAKHDNILYYVKDPKNYIFNKEEIDREPYMAPGLVSAQKADRKKLPTDTWWPKYSGAKITKSLSDTWWLYYTKGQNDTWWQTIVPTNSKERVGYPTQKPRKLIDRIIRASSFPGNTVLDFFAGSGTVGESCIELNRNFILVDNNQAALEVMAQRFDENENIRWIGFDPSPYQVKHNKQVKGNEENRPPIPAINPEVQMLAAMGSYLQEKIIDEENNWENSPFEWIVHLPARKKGKLGRHLLAAWLAGNGISTELAGTSSETLLIKGHKFSIKFSTLWNQGSYRFQQIRKTGYDYLICFGISPFAAHCWVFGREHALLNATQQHKGASEFWVSINPDNPDEWVKDCGGTLEEAFQILNKIKPKK